METRSKARKTAWAGQNWIRPAKRLAIYLRDGLACVWCGVAVEESVVLTLDHVRPYATGGGHDPRNLVTACHRCNSLRGSRGVTDFARAVASYVDAGTQPAEIVTRVRAAVRRPLDLETAKTLIARRGSCRRVLDAA